MKIKTFGARHFGGQISRLDTAFELLNHEVNKHNINDVIYCNDSENAGKAVEWKEKYGGKLVLNTLDIPHWIPDFTNHLNRISPLLARADILTCISNTAKEDIKKYLNYDAHVIYNPIKDVSFLGFKRYNSFLYAGRANDVNKRFNLVIETAEKFQFGIQNLIVCGSENPRRGKYLGIVKDEELNYLYNVSKYLIFPSLHEGMGLPIYESLVAGCVPIVTEDNAANREFLPNFMLCGPTPESMMNKILEYESGSYKEELKELGLKFSHKFDKMTIAQNILDIL